MIHCEKNLKLSNLLNYISRYVPYYRNLGELEFNDIPIVRKEDIRDHYDLFISDEIRCPEVEDVLFKKQLSRYTKEISLDDEKLFIEFSSGTTGMPFVMIKTSKERYKMGLAMHHMRNEVCKVLPTELYCLVHLSGVDKCRYPFPFPYIENDEERIEKEISFLDNGSIKWLHIHTLELEMYANYLRRTKREFNKNRTMKIIENAGAYLGPEDRKEFSKLFNCKFADMYGCSETWMIAETCKCGKHHINTENILFELVDEKTLTPIYEKNKVGRIVVTSYNQFVMPFVRFLMVDRAFYVDGVCMCGSKKPVIELVPGNDRIVGTKKSGRRYFEGIVCNINDESGITGYKHIHVTQIGKKKFVVNIKCNNEKKGVIENVFVEAARKINPEDDYIYSFTYDDSLVEEDIFSVSLQYTR